MRCIAIEPTRIANVFFYALKLAILAVSTLVFWQHAVVQAHPNHGSADLSIELIDPWMDREAPEEVFFTLRIKNGLGQAVSFRGLYSARGQKIQILKARKLLGLKSWAAVKSIHISPGEDKTLAYPEYRIRLKTDLWKKKSPELIAFFEGIGSVKVLVRND